MDNHPGRRMARGRLRRRVRALAGVHMTDTRTIHTATAVDALEKDRVRLIGEVDALRKENYILRRALSELMGVRGDRPVDSRTERHI